MTRVDQLIEILDNPSLSAVQRDTLQWAINKFKQDADSRKRYRSKTQKANSSIFTVATESLPPQGIIRFEETPVVIKVRGISQFIITKELSFLLVENEILAVIKEDKVFGAKRTRSRSVEPMESEDIKDRNRRVSMEVEELITKTQSFALDDFTSVYEIDKKYEKEKFIPILDKITLEHAYTIYYSASSSINSYFDCTKY